MGNPEKNALLGHNLNVIKQSEVSVILLVTKPHNLPLFSKEGLGEILWMKISKKSPLAPLFQRGVFKKCHDMSTHKFVAHPLKKKFIDKR